MYKGNGVSRKSQLAGGSTRLVDLLCISFLFSYLSYAVPIGLPWKSLPAGSAHVIRPVQRFFPELMILTDKKILEEMERGTIVITPFNKKFLGTNSYDVHLGRHLAVYKNDILDARVNNEIDFFPIPDEGLILLPHRLYLGVTEEYTETHAHVPFLEGKSSVGRLGIDIHATAGKGDVGFCNTWTLEISVKQPVRLYHSMPIGQLIYFEVSGDVGTPYHAKASAKYNTRTDKPVASMMWKNFQK